MNIKIEQYIVSYLSKIPNIDEKYIKDVIEIIRPYLNNHSDIIKIDKWLKSKNVLYRSNPTRFMKTTFVEELKSGSLERNRHCDPTSLLNVMRENKIEIKKNADVYIYTMFDFLYNEGYLNEKEIITCNHRAIKVLANQGKSTDDFIELYKKSKVGAERNFDWDAIEKEYKTNIKEWEELLSDEQRVIDNIRNTR